MGVKLVIFPGKYLDRDLTARKEILYEYQYNTLFSYAQAARLDADPDYGGQHWLLCAGRPHQTVYTAVQQTSVRSGRPQSWRDMSA